VLVATLLVVAGSSCRTSVSYEPRALTSSAEAVEVIRQTLETQHAQYAPIEVEVSEVKLSMLRNKSNPLLGTSGLNRTVIPFSSIGEVTLSRKNRWFAVTLAAVNGFVLLHVYTPDAQSAQRFMDAIETLRRLASPS
jgi:hypothetical protein